MRTRYFLVGAFCTLVVLLPLGGVLAQQEAQEQAAPEQSHAPEAQAAAQPSPEPPAMPVASTEVIPKCNVCHESEAPTSAEDAKLKNCPRPHEAPAKIEDNPSPDFVIMDQLSELYVPVVFPHKLHASMTDMGVGCATCHHANPDGHILKCSACHNGPSEATNLEKPSLKGAYHRQCLNCHREWDHKTDCAICHAKRAPGVEVKLPTDPTDIMGSLHPNIEAPDTKVYDAKELEDAPVVTFHHREHVDVFGLRCVDCHRKQNCSTCHDNGKREPHVRQDPHEDCVRCHEKETTDNCTYCHATEPTQGFDHERVAGVALAAYHKELSCRQCHGGAARMQPVDAKCETCHAPDWTPEKFDHSVTGLVLDENHIELDCIACHPNGMGKPTDCSACHDDGRTTFPPPEEAAKPKE
ncbi:MAG: cytochrome c family protein [Candidatus Hydrogenedentes bacterium]|nr:cytochrome c family protein [Candidatus Hydrogenedentota bacterium]